MEGTLIIGKNGTLEFRIDMPVAKAKELRKFAATGDTEINKELYNTVWSDEDFERFENG